MSLQNKTFNELITFTRATGGGRFNAAGQYEWLAADKPRFDFDPVTLEPRGILIEEQRANLLLRSAEFDNTIWGKTNVSVVANAATAPDGTMTADKLVPNKSVTTHPTSQSVSISGFVSFSVFLKSGEYSKIRLQIIGNGADARADFDAATGLASAVVTTSGFSSPIAARIDVVGGGWYRCSISGNIVATGIRNFIVYSQGSGDFLSAGDGTSGLYIWGAQLEAGAFPTSYIPTTTAQVTRAADSCFVNNLSHWYRADEGALFAEASIANYSSSSVIENVSASLGSSASNRMITRAYSDGSGNLQWDCIGYVNGGVEFDTAQRTFNSPNSTVRNGMTYKRNDIGNSVNGLAVSKDEVAEIPAVTNLHIGRSTGLPVAGAAHIRRIRYIPRRISDTELRALTAL